MSPSMESSRWPRDNGHHTGDHNIKHKNNGRQCKSEGSVNDRHVVVTFALRRLQAATTTDTFSAPRLADVSGCQPLTRAAGVFFFHYIFRRERPLS